MPTDKLLTDNKARSSTLPDGRHLAGDHLWLIVRGHGSHRSWVVRANGVDYSIGSIKKVSLAYAREQARTILNQLRDGLDPRDEKNKAAEAEARRKTFAQAADALMAIRTSGWRTSFEGRSSTKAQWAKDMAVVCKSIAALDIADVTIEDVKSIVAPYWDRGHLDRARALLGRIEAVLDYAIAHGWRTTDNPAAWKRFQYLFPKAQRGNDPHHAALDWREVPQLIQRLRQSSAIGARIVEFIILTAARSGEARGALWSEVDFDKRVWTVPGTRMKKAKEHRVPLNDQAIELLRAMPRVGEFVFPGGRGEIAQAADKPMSNASVWALVQRAIGDETATTHGFRSAFKDWANNQRIDEKMSERCLAHDVGDKTETAYARDTLAELRRPIMEAWGRYVDGQPADSNVLQLKKVA